MKKEWGETGHSTAIPSQNSGDIVWPSPALQVLKQGLCRNALKWEFCLLRKSAQNCGVWSSAVRASSKQPSPFQRGQTKATELKEKGARQGSTLGAQDPLHWQQEAAPKALQSPAGRKNFHRENLWAALGEVQSQSLNSPTHPRTSLYRISSEISAGRHGKRALWPIHLLPIKF